MAHVTPSTREARRGEIVALSQEGRSWREIADAIGISVGYAFNASPATCSTREPPPWLPEVVRLYAAGATLTDVRDAAGGASGHTIRRWLRAAGVEIRTPKRDGAPPLSEELIAMYRKGASILAIAELHGCAEPTAAKLLRAAGVTIRRPGRPG